MKKLLTALICATTVLGVGGCSSSREPLTDDQIKQNFSDNGYLLACTSSGFDFCSFGNSSSSEIIAYSDKTDFVYINGDSLYEVNSKKIIEGNGKAEDLEKKFNELIKSVDVTSDEVSTLLKKEFSSYQSELAAKKAEEQNKVFGIGDKVVVSEGDKEQFSFVVNSVKTTTERNQFSDDNPAQVVVINYSYENLGMDDDLYISSISFTVIDEDGNVANTYPAGANVYPQECPKGAKSDGEEAYGLKVNSKSIKLRLTEYLPNTYEKAERNFELKIN